MNPLDEPIAGTQCYQLPEDAYVLIQHTRDQLKLLARLAAPRSRQDDLPGSELQIEPAVLAHCFQQLTQQLDTSLAMTFWPRPSPLPSTAD